MRRCFVVIAMLTLFAARAFPATYVVLVSSGYTTSDGYANDPYWYGLYVAYASLVSCGIPHNRITVLYNQGEDFESVHPAFQNAWASQNGGSIVNRQMDDTTFAQVLDSLNGIVTSDDTLIVWWAVGHGFDYYGEYGTTTCLDNYWAHWVRQTGGTPAVISGALYDTTIASIINQVRHFNRRIIIWSTCNAEGIIGDLLEWGGDSTVVLAGVQWHHTMGSVVNRLESSDSVGMPGLTYYVAAALDRHLFSGAAFYTDTNNDGITQFSEIKYSVDSMYVRNPYLLTDNYGNLMPCPSPPSTPEPYDTTRLGDENELSASLSISSIHGAGSLVFTYRGNPLSRVSDRGYLHFAGIQDDGFPSSSLWLGSAVIIDTMGSFALGDTLLPDRGVWLVEPDSLGGGLLFRQASGLVACHISHSNTVRSRAWAIEQFPFEP